jgi:hypothetical protein
MRSNSLKRKLAAGHVATIVATTAPSSGFVTVLGYTGF